MARLLLVRHGQASWGAADYDQLSADGAEQGRQLGGHLARHGVRPALLVHGGMRRHVQTLEAMVEVSGWGAEPEQDDGWAEFDHVKVLAGHPTPWGEGDPPSKAAFQDWFDEALERWMDGAPVEGCETYADFCARVADALTRTGERIAELAARADGEETVGVVSTSGGPVSWAVAQLIRAGASSWRPLNRVVVNSAVTTVLIGERGLSMLTFNDYHHLPAELVTYR